MATVTVARAAHATLSAGVADSVVLGAAYQVVTVVNRGDDFLYITTDGTIPTVAGAECLVLPPRSAAELPVLAPVSGTAPTTTTVSVIATTAVPYSVTVSPLHLSRAGTSPVGATSTTISGTPTINVAALPVVAVSTTQAWTPFRLYQGSPTTETTLYTCPALTIVEVTQVLVAANASATWSLSAVASGGTAGASNRVAITAPVSANDVVTMSGLVLSAGDFLSGLLSVSSAVLTVFGRRRAA